MEEILQFLSVIGSILGLRLRDENSEEVLPLAAYIW